MRVVKGRLIHVANTDRRFGSADSYVAVQVEDADGCNERCLLFTDAEIMVAEARAESNPEDMTRKGFLTNLLD